MKRRTFLKSGAGIAAVAGVAAPAIAQERIEWNMPSSFPKPAPGVGTNATRFAELVEQLSGGRMVITVYGAGELVPPFAVEDAVQAGNAPIGHGTPYYAASKTAAAHWFTGVPFGLTANEHYAWLKWGGGQQIWDEIYAERNLKPFYSGNSGTQAGGWFKNVLTGVDSVKGLRFRTPGLGGRVWEKLGVTVTNMAAGEIFQALQSGTLDAAEFVGPYNDLALGFYQVAKNYYFPSFVEPGLATELVVDKKKYLDLPADLQAIIRDVAQAEYDQVASDFYANDPRALKTLIEKHGVQVHQFPESILKAGAEAAKEVMTGLRDSDDPLVRKTAENFIESLNIVRTRSKTTDGAFVNARENYFQI